MYDQMAIQMLLAQKGFTTVGIGADKGTRRDCGGTTRGRKVHILLIGGQGQLGDHGWIVKFPVCWGGGQLGSGMEGRGKKKNLGHKQSSHTGEIQGLKKTGDRDCW